METSLLVFAAAVVGSSIGPLVMALMNLRTAHKDRVEGRRKEKLEYFDRKLQALIELRGDLQWYQQGFDRFETEASKRREISYGKAYGIMMSVDDEEVHSSAATVMSEGASASDKLQAIDSAIKRLGKMTTQLLPEK